MPLELLLSIEQRELVNICRTPLINLEDVFLTGLCANEQLGLQLTHNEVRPVEVTNQTKSDNTFQKFIPRGPTSESSENICVFKTAVTVHNKYTPEMLQRLWSLTTQQNSSCP